MSKVEVTKIMKIYSMLNSSQVGLSITVRQGCESNAKLMTGMHTGPAIALGELCSRLGRHEEGGAKHPSGSIK